MNLGCLLILQSTVTRLLLVLEDDDDGGISSFLPSNACFHSNPGQETTMVEVTATLLGLSVCRLVRFDGVMSFMP